MGWVVWAPFAHTLRRAEVFTGTAESGADVRGMARQWVGLAGGGCGEPQALPSGCPSLLTVAKPAEHLEWAAVSRTGTGGEGCGGLRNSICNSRPCMGLSERCIAF